MNRVRIHTPVVDGDTLVCDVSTSGRVARFLSGEPFRATYSRPIECTPAHIRSIPVLAHVCPVAWATGADVVVDTADADFLDALRRIRSTVLDIYPEFMVGGSLDSHNTVEDGVEPGAFDEAGMLFTGGVDSTSTYLRHREDDPTLVSVRGWVIGPDENERWAETRDFVTTFAENRGLDTDYVESNMLEFLARPLLLAHFQRYLDGTWYSAVGHGLGLLGLCAPLADARGWGSLAIAASHTEEWARPWGSMPEIDDEVAWSGTECSHDGYELSRQEKVDRIATYVETESEALPLRTCIYDDGAGNCSACEKCYRTILGLVLAGLDPNEHGYDYDRETLAAIRRNIDTRAWNFKSHTCHHWETLQQAAQHASIDPQYGGDEFLEWFLQQDFESHAEATETALSRRFVHLLARKTPTHVYSTLYPVYRRVSTATA